MGTPENSGSLVVSGTNTKRNAVLPDIVATNDPAGITLDGAQVMTSDNLQIDAGDPLEFYESGGIRYLRMKGGTWVLPIDTQVELQGTANTDLNGIWIPVVADIFPFRTYPFLGICFGGTAATPAYGLDTTSGMIKPGTAYGIGFDAISIAKQIVAQTSDGFGSFYRIYTNGTTFTDAQCIAISNLPGGIAGEYVAANDDVHAGDGVYGRLYVRSYGPMQVGPIDGYRTALSGLLIHGGLTTNQLRIYADTDGIHLVIADDGQGFSGADAIKIDNPTSINGNTDITGSLAVTSRISAASSATHPTNGALIQGTSVAVGAAVANNASYATAGHMYFGATVGSANNVLDMSSGSQGTVFQHINNSATFSDFYFTGHTGAHTVVLFRAAGTNHVADLVSQPTGNMPARLYLYKPGSSGSSLNTTNPLVLSRTSSGATLDVSDSTADQALLITNSNGSFAVNVAMEGRLGLNTGTAPTSGAYLQTPSASISSTGTLIDGHWSATATLDFGSIAANSTSELTITVTGAADGDMVTATPANGIESGLIWSAYVSSANTVTVRLANVTTSAIDPASRSWRASVTSY